MQKHTKDIFECPEVEIVAFETEDIMVPSIGNPDLFGPDENEGPFVPAD